MRKRVSLLLVIALLAALSTSSVAFGSGEAAPAASAAAPAFRQRSGEATVGGSLFESAETADAAGIVSASGDVSASALAVFSNDCEGGVWSVVGGPANWGLTPYRKTNGSYSMYCAQTLRPAPGPYMNDCETWMMVGGIDLRGYTSAVLNFDIWMNAELDPDYYTDIFFAGVSLDSVNFDGEYIEGNTGGWLNVSVPISDYCGQSNVVIGLAFASDESIAYEGAYVDRVSLWAEPGNTPPVANSDSYSVAQNKARTIAAPGVLANDTDVNGNALSAALETYPAHGTLSLNSNGGFTYTPAAGYTGSDSFMYRAWDGAAYSGLGTVNLSIAPDVAPVAVNDSFTVIKDTTATFPSPGVLANDSDANGDSLTAEKMSDPAHGTASIAPSGALSYTPSPGYTGPDSFTYRAFDGVNYSATRTVTLNVVASPPMNVYRFYNNRAGTHFYTASESEKANIMATLAGTYSYEGVAYTLQPANCPAPLYRFYRFSSGTHFFTADESEKQRVQSTMGTMYGFEGIAYGVSSSSGGGTNPPVYRFFRPSTGTHFYTADESEKARVLSTMGHLYSFDGIAFYLGQ